MMRQYHEIQGIFRQILNSPFRNRLLQAQADWLAWFNLETRGHWWRNVKAKIISFELCLCLFNKNIFTMVHFLG